MDAPPALQALLEQRPLLQSMFNGGIFVTNIGGTAIADVPLSNGRIGTNYMDRESVSVPLREGKTVIGRPAMGKKLGAPIFSIIAPIRNTKGAVIGALVGTVNLGLPSFLDKVTHGQYGKSGHYLLNAKQSRMIVTATDHSRIMQPLPATGVNTMLDRYVQGFDGFGVSVNARGVEELTAAKGIPVAGWFLGLAVPTTDAFSPIASMQQRLMLATIMLTLLAGGLTWWLLRHELAPLHSTAQKLVEMAQLALDRQAVPSLFATKPDEIGELIGGFNQLLETLQRRDQYQRALLDNFPFAVWLKDTESRFLAVNQGFVNILGQPNAGELTGKNDFDIFILLFL
jgi:PAS domain-containing protein